MSSNNKQIDDTVKKQQQPFRVLTSALPTPLETWEQQQQRLSRISATTPAKTSLTRDQLGRRILPLPGVGGSGGTRKDVVESENARNVRLLLARHQQHQYLHQHQQQPLRPPAQSLSQTLINGVRDMDRSTRHPLTSIASEEDEEDDEDDEELSSDQFSSALLPGDSYPDTDNQLAEVPDEDGDDEENVDGAAGRTQTDEEDEEAILLRRLTQSQARMEQIKRMLVTQRGFIVQSLRLMAVANARRGPPVQVSPRKENTPTCATCKDCYCNVNEERDRTLGSTMRHGAAQRQRVDEPDVGVAPAVTSVETVLEASSRLCPMCEAVFPPEVDEEEFESHVVDHFCLEEAETLKYVPPQTCEEDQQA